MWRRLLRPGLALVAPASASLAIHAIDAPPAAEHGLAFAYEPPRPWGGGSAPAAEGGGGEGAWCVLASCLLSGAVVQVGGTAVAAELATKRGAVPPPLLPPLPALAQQQPQPVRLGGRNGARAVAADSPNGGATSGTSEGLA